MTSLGLLLSNALNFTYRISNLSKNFSLLLFLTMQSYNDFLFLANFFNNFIKI